MSVGNGNEQVIQGKDREYNLRPCTVEIPSVEPASKTQDVATKLERQA